MYASKKLDLLGRDLKTMSVAAGLTLWAPTSGIVAAWWRRFARDFAKPYRPELHYMRGPGPKWRAKRGIAEPGAHAPTSTLHHRGGFPQ